MWDFIFSARRIVGDLLLPPTGFALLTLAGLWLMRKRPRLGRWIAISSVGALLAVATPLGAELLYRAVAYPRMVDDGALGRAEAIVILGGGMRKHAPEFNAPSGETLGRWTLERVRYGALLTRQKSLPVLVTGGVAYPPDGSSEGAMMASVLISEYGVDVRWKEERARNTRENASLSAVILREAGIRRIALVTHATHLPRAMAEFSALGFDVIPAATFVPGPLVIEVLSFVPTMRALDSSYFALYEWLALAVNGAPTQSIAQ